MIYPDDLFEAFRQAEIAMSKAWGEFTMFGLFERDDIPGKYDVVVSGSQMIEGVRLSSDRRSLIRLADMAADTVGEVIKKEWWRQVGRFVVLDEGDPLVKAVLARMPNEGIQHDLQIVTDLYYDGEIIRSAAIITAQKQPIQKLPSESKRPQAVAA